MRAWLDQTSYVTKWLVTFYNDTGSMFSPVVHEPPKAWLSLKVEASMSFRPPRLPTGALDEMAFMRTLRDAGVPHVRLHDLRHTFAPMALAIRNAADRIDDAVKVALRKATRLSAAPA